MRSSVFDLSIIYSDSKETLETLRTNNGGLKMSPGNVLPQIPCEESMCYTGGDFRVTQTVPLALMHSLFYRCHNKIRDHFAEINPNWSADKLFFESRRLLIAIFQSILYNEWLPSFIGKIFYKSLIEVFVLL